MGRISYNQEINLFSGCCSILARSRWASCLLLAVVAVSLITVTLVMLARLGLLVSLTECGTIDIALLKILDVLLRCEDVLEVIEVSLSLSLTELSLALDILGLLLELLGAEFLDLCLLVSCKIKLCKRIHHARIRILKVWAWSITVVAWSTGSTARSCGTDGTVIASRLGKSRG